MQREYIGMHVLGIDVGGTKTVCLLANEEGTIVARAREAGANLQGVGELASRKGAPQRDGGRPGRPERHAIGDLSGHRRRRSRRRSARRARDHGPDRVQGDDSHRQRRAHRPAGGHRRRPWHRHRVGHRFDCVRAQRARRGRESRRVGPRARRRRQRLLDRPPRAAGGRPACRRTRPRNEPHSPPARTLRTHARGRTDSPRLSRSARPQRHRRPCPLRAAAPATRGIPSPQASSIRLPRNS